MPFMELLLHLRNRGDVIVNQSEEELFTWRGDRYVRSQNGLSYDGWSWRPKYLWVRV